MANTRRIAQVLLCLGTLAAVSPAVSADNPDHVRQLRATRSCPGCNLENADLAGLNAELGDLHNAILRGAALYKATLRGANLAGAVFTGADLSGADLTGARGANLTGAVSDETTRCPSGAQGPC